MKFRGVYDAKRGLSNLLKPNHERIKDELRIILKSRRSELKMNQTEFAALCGCTQARISQIETGNFADITIDTYFRMLARAGIELTFQVNYGSNEKR